MTASTLRFAISLATLAGAFRAFMGVKNTWVAVGAVTAVIILGTIIGQVIDRRFTDVEVRRRDLEDRVRNPPL